MTSLPAGPTMIPLFVRKFVLDFVESAIAAIFLLQVVFPTDVAEAYKVAVTVGLAVLSALVSAIRRATPDFIGWLSTKLGTG